MHKKDYEKFATMLKAATPKYPFTYHVVMTSEEEKLFNGQMEYHANMVQSIACIFADDNPNFNKQRFINTIVGKET